MYSANQKKNYHQLPVVLINLNKYMGSWYEIARLPVIYQNDCTKSMGTYTLNPNNTINIVYQCLTGSGIVYFKGTGNLVDNYQIVDGKIMVKGRFNMVSDTPIEYKNTVSPDHNILLVDKDYKHSLVGTPDRNGLWISSRDGTIDLDTYKKYVAYAKNQGYDTDKLIFDDWTQ